MAFEVVKVIYGGYWTDCTYNGGTYLDVPLSKDAISIDNLQYHISLYCNPSGTAYDIFYLTMSEHRRTVKSRLRTDQQLNWLCRTESFPTVYVSSSEGASSSYVPTIDHDEPYRGSFGQDTDGTGNLEAELELIRRFATSTDWTENVYHRESNIGFDSFHDTVPDLNRTVEGAQEARNEPSLFDDDDDDEDENYVLETEESSESEGESNLYAGDRSVNRALFAEWAAWIHEEGGMQKLLDMMYPESNTDQPEVDTDTAHMSNWLVPMVPLEPGSSAVFHEENLNIEDLAVNAVYYTKAELGIAVGLWHLERRKEYKVKKSDTTRVVLKCKLSAECRFHLRATSFGGPWTVKKIRLQHTCDEVGMTNVVRRKVHSKVIGAFFANKIMRDSEVMKPKIIQNELRARFGIDASYDVCLKGRNCAIEMIYGKFTESFEDLPGYLHMLKMSNPGTKTEIDIGPDERFRHVFIALAASRHAYRSKCLRPVVCVDGTHLKGKNCGTMFVAVAKDANEQLFPLAYGIGPIENNESWTWFMTALRKAYGAMRDWLFVSDQHASIIHAVAEVFPEAHHGLCYYHLSKKMMGFGSEVGAYFQRAAYTYDKHVFDTIMAALQREARAAYRELIDIGEEKWSKCMCPVRRFSNMTSNAAESFNKSLLWARRLPICACLDAVRLIIDRWFTDCRRKARNDSHPITVEARRKVCVQLERSHDYTATQIDDHAHYRVVTSGRTVHVDLEGLLCQCSEWQTDCLPCAHAIAAMT